MNQLNILRRYNRCCFISQILPNSDPYEIVKTIVTTTECILFYKIIANAVFPSRNDGL